MARLSAVIAEVKDRKRTANEAATAFYQKAQKSNLLTGLARTYRPKNDEGETKPSEYQKVQLKCFEGLREVAAELETLLDVVATQDYGNLEAKGKIVIGDKVIAENVPATYLLFLEKQLVDLHTNIKKLPVLSADENWNYDSKQDLYVADPTETVSTKKVYRNHVKAAATDKFPAQVEVYTEDEVVGYWRTVKFSGALPARTVRELTRRVEELQRAVHNAIEEANAANVKKVSIGKSVLGYVLEALKEE